MKYATDLFKRLSPEKQERILKKATQEFSALGFKTANINVIAKKCKVSVGALYKYFITKENLFLTVCSRAVDQLSEGLNQVEHSGSGIMDKIEALLRLILSHSRKNKNLINLYNEITTEANKELAARLSFQMESLSAEYYQSLLSKAQTEGLLPEDTDIEVASFCLDNIFMSLQFSYASEYYRERMKIYVDENILDQDERMIQGTLDFIGNALGLRK